MPKNKLDTSQWIRPVLIGVIGLVVIFLIGRQVAAVPATQAAGDSGVTASGIVKADEVAIASEFGGRIAQMPVVEGDHVTAGQLVVQLDTQVLDAQIESMDATIELAQAALAKAKAGARTGQLAVAQAQLDQAQAGVVAARRAVTDTQALVANPQEIDLQLEVAQSQLAADQALLDKAVATERSAKVGNDDYETESRILTGIHDKLKSIPEPYRPTLPLLPLDYYLLQNNYWQAWVGVNSADAQKKGAEEQLAQLKSEQTNPQSLNTMADQAQSTLAQAEAQAAAAQAQLAGLQAGATTEQLAALEARIAQAQAGRASLVRQRDLFRVTAPLTGTVTEVVMHQGEVAAQGATLLNIAPLDTVTLKVYVPETQIGLIHLGQSAQVTVDSFPGRTFSGRVSHIADESEYTPRNVATQEERVNLVFAVEIRLPNSDGALVPGMPADAKFGN